MPSLSEDLTPVNQTLAGFRPLWRGSSGSCVTRVYKCAYKCDTLIFNAHIKIIPNPRAIWFLDASLPKMLLSGNFQRFGMHVHYMHSQIIHLVSSPWLESWVFSSHPGCLWMLLTVHKEPVGTASSSLSQLMRTPSPMLRILKDLLHNPCFQSCCFLTARLWLNLSSGGRQGDCPVGCYAVSWAKTQLDSRSEPHNGSDHMQNFSLTLMFRFPIGIGLKTQTLHLNNQSFLGAGQSQFISVLNNIHFS